MLPGFGVVGISGILLVMGSLGLVAYGHWPHGNEEWIGFGHKLGPFGVSILGSVAAASSWWRVSAEHSRTLNRLMLHGRARRARRERAGRDPLHAEMQALLGAIGVAATPLRPAGKTQFGDDFVDVVAEGGYVCSGRASR